MWAPPIPRMRNPAKVVMVVRGTTNNVVRKTRLRKRYPLEIYEVFPLSFMATKKRKNVSRRRGIVPTRPVVARRFA